MPNCTITGRRPTITWVSIIHINFTHLHNNNLITYCAGIHKNDQMRISLVILLLK